MKFSDKISELFNCFFIYFFLKVLLALQNWMMRDHTLFIWISAFVIIIFRSELCILLGLILLQELSTRKLKFTKAIVHSALAGACALCKCYNWVYTVEILNKSHNYCFFDPSSYAIDMLFE